MAWILEQCQRLLSETTAPIHEGELIFKTIRSLPASWKHYVEGLRANQQLISSYDELKKALIYEHSYRSFIGQGESNRTALSTKKGKSKEFVGKCYVCNEKGHKKQDCWVPGGGKEGEESPREKEANTVTESYL